MSVCLGAIIPVNTNFKEADEGFDIYVTSNGIHADVMVPFRSEVMDWSSRFPMSDFSVDDKQVNYIVFGWGDKAIFINTPTWAELKFSDAARALVGLNGSVMHVEPRYISPEDPLISPDVVRIRISRAQLMLLTRYIEHGFVWRGEPKTPTRIATGVYSNHDAFYEARGRYSFLVTCNEWLRRGLSEAGIRTPLWAPFVSAIFYQLRKIGR